MGRKEGIKSSFRAIALHFRKTLIIHNFSLDGGCCKKLFRLVGGLKLISINIKVIL